MILLWFTAGVVPAVLLGVYLPWSAWVLPVGLGSLAAGFLFKGLKKWPPLRRFLFGAGAILVWLAVYSALFHAPAQDLEHRTIQMEGNGLPGAAKRKEVYTSCVCSTFSGR